MGCKSNFYLYSITNSLNGKIYFGKTIDVNARWYDHRHAARHGSKFPIHCAIRKYGEENFVMNILGQFDSNVDVSNAERLAIKSTPKERCYNVAEGGDGGHTMTEQQLQAQYAISSVQYDDFIMYFHDGRTQKEMMVIFDASLNAVKSCAARLGLSFGQRRSAKKAQKIVKHRERKPKITSLLSRPQIDASVRDAILKLYLHEDKTANEVSDELKISKGCVRATISIAYAAMTQEEHDAWKKRHGSAVRSGVRNSNFGKRRHV